MALLLKSELTEMLRRSIPRLAKEPTVDPSESAVKMRQTLQQQAAEALRKLGS